MASTPLRQAAIVHASATDIPQDVLITDGMIAEVGPTIAAVVDETIDLTGWTLSPVAVEPHAHLDKAFLAEEIANPAGDLMGAIDAMVSNRFRLDVASTIERAERAARLMASNGYRMVRTHADATIEHGLRSAESLSEVRRRLVDVIDIETVALCGWADRRPSCPLHQPMYG